MKNTREGVGGALWRVVSQHTDGGRKASVWLILNDETHVPRSMRYMVVNDSFGCVPPCCAVRE